MSKKEENANFDAAKEFEQSFHGARIEKLYWIAGSFDSKDLRDDLSEMSDAQFKECFPEIYKSSHYKNYRRDNELVQAIIDFRKFGLFAIINLPKCHNFSFENGLEQPSSFTINYGVSRIRYCYAETLDGLMKRVEDIANETLKQYIKEDYQPLVETK